MTRLYRGDENGPRHPHIIIGFKEFKG